jgi:hypothetical protein
MQNAPIRTSGRTWPFLEPAMVPDVARTFHVGLLAAGAGLVVPYRKGQVIRQKDDGTNVWAINGTAGYEGPACIMKYSTIVNAAGKHQLSEEIAWDSGKETFEGTVDAYYSGYFKTQDLISAGGTNEVQTLTIDADVDGGTYTLSLFGYVTAAIAFDANAAAIETAILAAVPVIANADLTVAGAGPFTFTFAGAYAGASIPAIGVNTNGMTDGGAAVVDNSTAIVRTTPGAGLLTGVGRLVRGTTANGIMQLGVGAPA